jgi:hypothetical protein
MELAHYHGCWQALEISILAGITIVPELSNDKHLIKLSFALT